MPDAEGADRYPRALAAALGSARESQMYDVGDVHADALKVACQRTTGRLR